MTVEEIKESIEMVEGLRRYGLTILKGGMINCPFHSDKTPSMKIYKDSFFCFSCGANGDIFTFVQMMENVSFKEAFQILGGTYEKPTFASRLAVYHSRKRREMARKEQERIEARKQFNLQLIGLYRRYLERSEPFSQTWTDCYNALQYQLYLQAELNDMEARW